MRSLLAKFVRRMAKDYPRRSVAYDLHGFNVAVEDGPGSGMRWSDIDTIFTRKIDLFSYDEVLLGFGQRSANLVIEVGEHHEGFQPFVEEVLWRYPTIPVNWFSEVAFPAFEPNFKVLWARDESVA